MLGSRFGFSGASNIVSAFGLFLFYLGSDPDSISTRNRKPAGEIIWIKFFEIHPSILIRCFWKEISYPDPGFFSPGVESGSDSYQPGSATCWETHLLTVSSFSAFFFGLILFIQSDFMSHIMFTAKYQSNNVP